MTHLYQLCYNARRMDRHSEAELWARFKAVRPQDACAVTPARPAPHPMPEQIDAALKWARCTSFPELVSQEDIDREQYGSMRMLVWVIITTALGWASLVLWWIL